MQIAQVLAGYSLGGADLLRRAMGKKKPEEMAEQRGVFLKGATERGVEPARASHIFDQMETFAGYGFNKSHAAAYALIAYQTAWLKTHYPEAYMAAVLTADLDNTDRLVVLKDELNKHMGIVLEPPDVNRSVLRVHRRRPEAHQLRVGGAQGRRPERRRGHRDRARRRAAPSRASSTFAGAWISRRSIGACSRRSRGRERSILSARIARR